MPGPVLEPLNRVTRQKVHSSCRRSAFAIEYIFHFSFHSFAQTYALLQLPHQWQHPWVLSS